MHKTGGGDDFVGGIAVKIQRFDRTADIECQRLEENWLSVSSKKKALHLAPKSRRLPRFCSRVAFPWAGDFVGNPTAIEITGLRAHGLAIDEALDAAGIEGKVA